MAFIEVCDMCGEKIDRKEGVFIKIKDVKKVYCEESYVKEQRKLHICYKCVGNIKRYCIEYRHD